MKFVLPILTLSLLLAGCSRPDEKLGHDITGIWTNSVERYTFSPDGSYSLIFGPRDDGASYQGTWLVKDGELVTTVTNVQVTGDYKAGPVGFVGRLKILHVDDHAIIYEFGGQRIGLRR
jgi:hypothetical protein